MRRLRAVARRWSRALRLPLTSVGSEPKEGDFALASVNQRQDRFDWIPDRGPVAVIGIDCHHLRPAIRGHDPQIVHLSAKHPAKCPRTIRAAGDKAMSASRDKF